MRFDQKIMNYVCGELTSTRLNNCRRAIERQADSFGGGFTALQIITLKSMLKTLKRRIETETEGQKKEHLMYQFNFLFEDIMSFAELKK